MTSLSSRFDKIAPLVAIPLFLFSAYVMVRFAIMGDKGWLMLAANKWVEGRIIARDIFEVNPPLIIWLYGIPAWVAHKVPGVTDYQALGVLGLLAVAVAIFLCLRIIARHPAFAEGFAGRMEFGLLITYVTLFYTSPVFFFDREHIMLTLTLPYMLRFMPSLAHVKYPLPLKLCIGLCAAIGFSIKPPSLLVFAALELILLVREKSPFILASAENVTIYLFGIVYCALILYFAPEYVKTIAPMAFTAYAGYNVKGSFRYYVPLILLNFLVPLLDFRPHYKTPYRRDLYYFMLICCIYCGYAYINHGWGYTYQPLFAILAILNVWVLWEYIWLKGEQKKQGLSSRQFDIGIRGAMYCLILNGVWQLITLQSAFYSPTCGGYNGCSDNESFTTAIKEKNIHTFGVMSGEFTRWPLISRESGARWETRFNHLWMIPTLMKDETEKDITGRWAADRWIVEYVGKAYAQDFTAHKPDAMFIDNSDEFFTYGKPVDVISVLSTVPEFKEAWKQYRYDSTLNRCHSKLPESGRTVGCRYDIYLRRH